MTGLGIGVYSMKSGERALLHVHSELGYGKEGNFSFPNVPPMADILYEVELIGFDETQEVSCPVFDELVCSSLKPDGLDLIIVLIVQLSLTISFIGESS